MLLLDKRSSFILLAFCLPLLFLPKVNLVSLGQQTAGLRIDDVVLLLFFFFCFWANLSVSRSFTSIENCVFAIVAASLVSFSINNLLVASDILSVSSSFFYCFRLLEYFLFFYIGMLAFRFLSLNAVVWAFFLWNFLLMMLQKMQVVGIFSVEGYIAKPDDRMLGIASFGSEIGLLLNILFCFLLFQEKIPASLSKRIHLPASVKSCLRMLQPYLLLLLFIFLVVLSGARMAILALMVSFLFKLKELINWRRPVTLLLPAFTLMLGTALMLFFLYHSSNIVTRSKGLFSLANIELVATVWDNISLEYDPIGKESVRQGDHDASWWMRIHKWCYALKFYISHPECWLQGVGPGFAMAALDGGFLRILTELGVIGCLLYGRLFYLIACQNRTLFWVMMVFLINMTFFDVYLAYKPMSLLFFIVGYSFVEKDHRERVHFF